MSKEQIEYIVLGILESAAADAFGTGLAGVTREQDAILDRMWVLAHEDPEILSWPVLVRADDQYFSGAVN